VVGELGALLNRIDAGYQYRDNTIGAGDGSLALNNPNFDYRSYLINEFPDLLANVLIRFYYLALIRPTDMPDTLFGPPPDPDFDTDEPEWWTSTSPRQILDAVHSRIEFVDTTEEQNFCNANFKYFCGKTGSHFNERTYIYRGLFREGQCVDTALNPNDSNKESCDRIENLVNEFDEMLKYLDGLKYLEGAAKGYTPEFVLTQVLKDYGPDEQEVPGFRDEYNESKYNVLQGWQQQILIWRGLLQSVLPAQQSLLQDCYDMCSNEICNVLPVTTDCALVNPACEKMQGLLEFEQDVTYDRAYTEVVGGVYEPLTEECCLGPDRTKCARPIVGGMSGQRWNCTDRDGKIDWDCYSTCYNQEYWYRHPAFSVTADERRSCADFCLPNSQPLICYWATPGCQSSFNPAYGGINCSFVCQRACRSAFNTEHGSSGPLNTTVLFNSKIQMALNILGDPANEAAGGLYWEIEHLMGPSGPLQQAYNTLESLISAARNRAVYGWKDTEGWHLIMSEVGSFSIPGISFSSDSSWLGIKKEYCYHLNMGSSPFVDVWAWRYDQSREVKFAGSGNLPWWTLRMGRKDAQEDEPGFMNDPTKTNWKDLSMLDPDESQEVACFLCEYGLRSHSRARFGTDRWGIRIEQSTWRTPTHSCDACSP
jgi:hypothetical protein